MRFCTLAFSLDPEQAVTLARITMPRLRIAFCALSFALVQGCGTIHAVAPTTPNSPTVNLPAPYTQQDVKVAVERLWTDGYGKVIGVSGTATNIGQVDLLTCNIYLNVIGASGVKVSTAHATMLGLKSGQTWEFQAMFLTPYAVTFKSIEPGTVMAMNERK
jgi:hypothetical protein